MTEAVDYPELVYALEEPPESFKKAVFLAGPTPRNADIASWRPEAVDVLQDEGFDGTIFIPEDRSGKWHGDTVAQIEWEDRCLNMADCIMFWVPRFMDNMPALTTNVEFGRWEDSGKVVFGAPKDAVHNSYLEHYCDKLAAPRADSLQGLARLAIEMLGEGAERSAGEREVPLHIWQTPSFQQWYGNLGLAGNRLDHAKQLWSYRVGPDQQHIFAWAMQADVFVGSENRHKTNEFVLSRPDISTTVMYKRASNLDDSEVVLVKEFRTPASNAQGYVYENPGGSTFKPNSDPASTAAAELEEETGLKLAPERLTRHEARQLAATFSAHKAHLFSAEINEQELDYLRSQAGIAHGVEGDSERTFVEITTLGQLRQADNVDWSMLGMILQVLAENQQ